MAFVLDASVAIAWILTDERSPIAEAAGRRLSEEDAFVPTLWWFEVRNVVLMHERRGRLPLSRANGALALLRQQPVVLDHPVDDIRVITLAREHRLTVYDAAYLELAQRRGLDLATLDRELTLAARSTGVACLEAHG